VRSGADAEAVEGEPAAGGGPGSGDAELNDRTEIRALMAESLREPATASE